MHVLNPSKDKLSSISGNQATLSWQSIPKLKGGKGNPQQGRIRKVSTAPVTLGGTGVYAMRKLAEGEFDSVTEVKDRAWGTRVGNSCIIEHKGGFYAEFYTDAKPVTTYYLDDEEIAKEDIDGLPESKRDSKVVPVTPKLQNVLVLSESPEKAVVAKAGEKAVTVPKAATVMHIYRDKATGRFMKKPA